VWPSRMIVSFSAIIIFCLCRFAVESSMHNDYEISVFGRAIKEIVPTISSEFKVVRIVVVDENEKQFNDEIDAIVRSSEEATIFEILRGDHGCVFNCILLFDTLEMMQEHFNNEKMAAMKIGIYYIRNTTFDELKRHLGINHKVNVEARSVYILYNNGYNSIDLVVLMQFTFENEKFHPKCLVTMNQFSIANLSWQQPLQKIEIITDLQGYGANFMSLTVFDGVTVDSGKHKFTIKQGDHILSGYFIHIIEELAKIGNFKAKYDNIESFEEYNKQFNVYIPQAMDPNSTLNYQDSALKMKKKRITIPLIYKELYFAIPIGERFTELEILFLAFDTATWLMILLTLLVSFIVVAFIGFTSQNMRNCVFGENVSTPSLNILAAFFGIPQAVLPGRNFARFLLMAFVMWSLLIRTCYVGVLFEYLKGDGRKAPIKSIDEMLDRNFTYFIFQEHCLLIGDMNLTGR